MSYTLEMNVNEQREFLHKMRLRYWKTKRKKDKGQLLDEIEAVTGLDRKALIRLIWGDLTYKGCRWERGRICGPKIEDAVRVIARSLDYSCN
jgi:hypothetical protein